MTFPRTEKGACYGRENPTAAGSRQRDLLEVSIGYGLILIAIWTPLPWQRMVDLAALAWVLFATVRSFEGWGAMGLGMSGLLRSLWIVGVALLLAAFAITLAGTFHTLPL